MAMAKRGSPGWVSVSGSLPGRVRAFVCGGTIKEKRNSKSAGLRKWQILF
jgi:hypothetical protein